MRLTAEVLRGGGINLACELLHWQTLEIESEAQELKVEENSTPRDSAPQTLGSDLAFLWPPSSLSPRQLSHPGRPTTRITRIQDAESNTVFRS